MSSTGNSLFMTEDPETPRRPRLGGPLVLGERATGKRRADTEPDLNQGEVDHREKRVRRSEPVAATSVAQSIERETVIKRETSPEARPRTTRREVITIEDTPPPSSPTPPARIQEAEGDITDIVRRNHLKHVDIWVDEGEEFATLQQMFHDTIKTAQKLAKERTDPKQRLGEICTDVMAKPAPYILRSYANSWKKVLRTVLTSLEKEAKQMLDFYEAVSREDTEVRIRKILDICDNRVAKFKEADQLRQKVIDDLKLL